MSVKLTICLGKTCRANFSADILKETEKQLKCTVYESSPDGVFELNQAICMNNCKHGPSVKFDEHLLSQMTPKEVKMLIKAYQNGNHAFIESVMEEAK